MYMYIERKKTAATIYSIFLLYFYLDNKTLNNETLNKILTLSFCEIID